MSGIIVGAVVLVLLLLARTGVEPPYMLVGHSAGGLYARVYAHQYPDEVAGMVLVDAGHEDLDVLCRYPKWAICPWSCSRGGGPICP